MESLFFVLFIIWCYYQVISQEYIKMENLQNRLYSTISIAAIKSDKMQSFHFLCGYRRASKGEVLCREGQLKMSNKNVDLLSRLWITAASLLEKDWQGESLKDYRGQRINTFFCISLCLFNNFPAASCLQICLFVLLQRVLLSCVGHVLPLSLLQILVQLLLNNILVCLHYTKATWCNLCVNLSLIQLRITNLKLKIWLLIILQYDAINI